jgi:pimeloyl-ACP methyl ester carboxylesterase
MDIWPAGYITTNGIEIHYYRTGGNKPPIVINHGAGDDGLCWTRIAKVLQVDYDVILPDARGHGKSASGEGDYSTQARLADLASLLQALNLDRPVIGGHSMGADTCLHYAAVYPDQVRGIFLEDPPIILPGDTFSARGRTISAEDAGKLMARMMLIFKLMPKFIGIRLARRISPTYPDDEIIPWINSKRRVSFNFLKALPTMELHQLSPFEAFKRVTAPIMLFIGDREKMAIVSQDAAKEAVKANDKVEVLHLEGASHDIRRTRFDGYMPALQAFLSSSYQV